MVWKQQNPLVVERLSDNAKLPHRAHDDDLCYDLFSSERLIIWPGKLEKVHTGIKMAFPEGWGAKIFDRSSVATKHSVFVVAGVIDSGYRGEILIAMYDGSEVAFEIDIGTKIAQMVVLPVIGFDIVESKLEGQTKRGDKGFGSTGV
jgi:dUTP pyrophosphatase